MESLIGPTIFLAAFFAVLFLAWLKDGLCPRCKQRATFTSDTYTCNKCGYTYRELGM